MTSISHSGLVETRAAPRAKVRDASIDRARTFLTLVVLIHHAVIPYLFRSYRCQVVDRFRRDRARHRQFLHGDVLFPVWPVRMAGHCSEGTDWTFPWVCGGCTEPTYKDW